MIGPWTRSTNETGRSCDAEADRRVRSSVCRVARTSPGRGPRGRSDAGYGASSAPCGAEAIGLEILAREAAGEEAAGRGEAAERLLVDAPTAPTARRGRRGRRRPAPRPSRARARRGPRICAAAMPGTTRGGSRSSSRQTNAAAAAARREPRRERRAGVADVDLPRGRRGVAAAGGLGRIAAAYGSRPAARQRAFARLRP